MAAATKVKKQKDQYMRMIATFPLRKLQSEDDYARAYSLVRDVASDKQLDEGMQRYFEVLIDLIAEYEKGAGHRLATSKLSPGEIVKHLAEENGMTLAELAEEIGIGQSNLSEMVNGKRDWSKKAIVALHERFLLDPMLFLTAA